MIYFPTSESIYKVIKFHLAKIVKIKKPKTRMHLPLTSFFFSRIFLFINCKVFAKTIK